MNYGNASLSLLHLFGRPCVMHERFRHALTALLLLAAPLPALAGLFDAWSGESESARLGKERDFLPADEAFQLRETAAIDGRQTLTFTIAPGYYLYRDRLQIRPLSEGLTFAPLALPAGEAKHDEEFGDVIIYRNAVTFDVQPTAWPPGSTLPEAEIRYMGCAEDGICYPPIKKSLAFTRPLQAGTVAVTSRITTPSDADHTNIYPGTATSLSVTDTITADLGRRTLLATLLTFFGLGLLLALTPCVLPMVPILSGIIVGQGRQVSTSRALALSTTYVVAMALAYAGAGVAAGLLGRNLQATFQHPAVIIVFSAIFVALALSMFGLFELALPGALQSRLDSVSRTQRSGSYGGVAAMGVLSAIIVGPCVAPPLAGALAYIGQTGSAVTGGSALFALGLGMGVPLIVLGTSAGALLPRAGAWMTGIKQVFGVILLGVAVWFLSRIVSGPLALTLWALLLIGSAMFMGTLEGMRPGAPAVRRLTQGLGLAFLLYGAVLIVGAAAGANDPLAPLAPLLGDQRASTATVPAFITVKSVVELDTQLKRAASERRAVMLDVYADWCIECKHLESQTFADPAIASRLAQLVTLRADVTADDAIDRALLQRFGLYGPPAVLFFIGGEELRALRLVGFAGPAAFGAQLAQVEAALK